MDENSHYFMRRSHVPAFGSWDYNHDEFPIPFTQCFESTRQADLLRYSYSEDRDLYVAGDLYQNDIVTPAMIVVPRRKIRKASRNEVKGKEEAWVVYNCDYDVKEPPILVSPKKAPKAVDEDLYKISPELLYAKPKKRGIRGFFLSCLLPTCAS